MSDKSREVTHICQDPIASPIPAPLAPSRAVAIVTRLAKPLTHSRPLPKRIAILGSTGSIGCNALEVIEALGPDYQAVALAGHRSTDKLIEQVRRHRPAAVSLCAEAA